jgi:hypothetical protein
MSDHDEKCQDAELGNNSNTDDLANRIRNWQGLSNDGFRLRCGELTPGEIRAIRAVLNAILPNP